MKLQKKLLCCLFVLLLLPVQAFATDNAVDMHFGFTDGFSCDNQTDNALMSYGNMAFKNVGASGKALDLQDGYLTIKNSENWQLKDSFSIAVWVNFNNTDSVSPMLVSRTASNGDPFNGPLAVSLTEDYTALKTDITFKMKDGTYKSYVSYTEPVLSRDAFINKWHHIAVVFAQNTVWYYFDGIPIAATTLPQELSDYETIANNNQPFSIGRGKGININAVMDEIHFSSEPILYENILSHLAAGLPDGETEIIVTEGYNTVWVDETCYYAPANIVKDASTGELMIPAKAVMQHMGAQIAWDGSDRMGRLDITYNNTTVSVWRMDIYANVNGNRLLELKTAPDTYNGSAFIPASLLRDAFGIHTEWNDALKQLTITF